MPYKKGDRLFHVDASGNIQNAVAAEDEKGGVLPVEYPNGRKSDIGTFNIFSTEKAANRAALDRTARKRPSKPVTFLRNPK